ncbi:hypothetical protein C8R44DRAFT_887128 [Mycena epipterygia]|nr:hypothetical protein C8R44DRAFT_887128 [Mycena epipterygia]
MRTVNASIFLFAALSLTGAHAAALPTVSRRQVSTVQCPPTDTDGVSLSGSLNTRQVADTVVCSYDTSLGPRTCTYSAADGTLAPGGAPSCPTNANGSSSSSAPASASAPAESSSASASVTITCPDTDTDGVSVSGTSTTNVLSCSYDTSLGPRTCVYAASGTLTPGGAPSCPPNAISDPLSDPSSAAPSAPASGTPSSSASSALSSPAPSSAASPAKPSSSSSAVPSKAANNAQASASPSPSAKPAKSGALHVDAGVPAVLLGYQRCFGYEDEDVRMRT